MYDSRGCKLVPHDANSTYIYILAIQVTTLSQPQTAIHFQTQPRCS